MSDRRWHAWLPLTALLHPHGSPEHAQILARFPGCGAWPDDGRYFVSAGRSPKLADLVFALVGVTCELWEESPNLDEFTISPDLDTVNPLDEYTVGYKKTHG